MTPSQAKELIEKVAKVTEQAFRTCDGIDPVFHFEGDRGFTSLLCPMEYTPETKDLVAAVIRRALEIDNAKWVMMVSEAWSLEQSALEGFPKDLEHAPGRREIIFYRLEDTDIPEMAAEQEIFRPEGKPRYLGELIIKEPPISGTSEGRMVGLLPKGKMSS